MVERLNCTNSNEVLNQKSIDNLAIARRLQEEAYYAASLNRYYYSALQKMKYVLLSDDPTFTVPRGKDSHKYILEQFQSAQTVKSNQLVGRFRFLKKGRICADYEPIEIDEVMFSEYKATFDLVNEVLLIT